MSYYQICKIYQSSFFNKNFRINVNADMIPLYNELNTNTKYSSNYEKTP